MTSAGNVGDTVNVSVALQLWTVGALGLWSMTSKLQLKHRDKTEHYVNTNSACATCYENSAPVLIIFLALEVDFVQMFS